MAVVSVAFDPSAAFWTFIFDLADQVERADPARAALAPLRGRVDLLATAVGVSVEADVWPHLRGITASIFGDVREPGVPTGALIVLHIDAAAAAEKIASEIIPRLCTIPTGKKQLVGRLGGSVGLADRRNVGTVGGRGLLVWKQERDVLLAWGEDVFAACRDSEGKPERSVAPLCGDWARAGNRAPSRVGALWPTRCWSPASVAFACPAWRTLAEDPPAVWWGWNADDVAVDSIHCGGLKRRIERFLDQVPGNGR